MEILPQVGREEFHDPSSKQWISCPPNILYPRLQVNSAVVCTPSDNKTVDPLDKDCRVVQSTVDVKKLS